MITLSNNSYSADEIGLKLLPKKLFLDDRGALLKTIETEGGQVFPSTGICDQYLSTTSEGVFRGLHYQKPPYSACKLINVIQGDVVDCGICVDKRSDFYGVGYKVKISESTPFLLLVPHYFAHGFFTTSKRSVVLSSMNNKYSQNHEQCFRYTLVHDTLFIGDELIVSEKDSQGQVELGV